MRIPAQGLQVQSGALRRVLQGPTRLVGQPPQGGACLTPAILAVHWELVSEHCVCTNAETESGEAPSLPPSRQAPCPGLRSHGRGCTALGRLLHICCMLHLVLAPPPSGEDRSTQVFRGSGRTLALASRSSPPSGVHMRTRMCTHTGTATHTCTSACTCTVAQEHTQRSQHMHSQAQTSMHPCTHACDTRAHTGPHACAYVHRHTLMSAHSCTNTLLCTCTA